MAETMPLTMFAVKPEGRLMRVLLIASLLLTVDCGSTCEDIARDRAAFASRKPVAHGPDARLTIPFRVLDQALAKQIANRPPVTAELPVKQLGIDLELSARLTGLRAAPAPEGKLGVIAEVGLFDSDRSIIDATLETAITPTLGDALVLRVSGNDLGAVTPRTTPESRKRLASWLKSKLPKSARIFADDALVGVAADELLGLFGREVWPRIKGPLLGHRELATSIALPELPIAGVIVRTGDRMLELDLKTSLPLASSEPLPETEARELALVLSGPTAAALVNEGMERGLVPGRFSAAGKPKPDGAYEARVGWQSGSRPLRVHLWQSDPQRGECRSAVMAGALEAKVVGDELEVAVRDGTIGAVRGPAMTEALAWLDALWRDAIEVVFRVASHVAFEADGQTIELRARDVRVDQGALRVELADP